MASFASTVGAFTAPTSNQVQTVTLPTGFGTPKAIEFFWTFDRNLSDPPTVNNHCTFGHGFADGTSEQTMQIWARNGLQNGSSAAVSQCDDDSCIQVLNPVNGSDYVEATLDSFNDGNFKLDWSLTHANSIVVMYRVWAGDDLTAKCGTFSTSATQDVDTVRNISLRPDVLITSSVYGAFDDTNRNDANISVTLQHRKTNDTPNTRAFSWASEHGYTTQNASVRIDTTNAYQLKGSDGTSLAGYTAHSFTDNGWTDRTKAAATAVPYAYLAIQYHGTAANRDSRDRNTYGYDIPSTDGVDGTSALDQLETGIMFVTGAAANGTTYSDTTAGWFGVSGFSRNATSSGTASYFGCGVSLDHGLGGLGLTKTVSKCLSSEDYPVYCPDDTGATSTQDSATHTDGLWATSSVLDRDEWAFDWNRAATWGGGKAMVQTDHASQSSSSVIASTGDLTLAPSVWANSLMAAETTGDMSLVASVWANALASMGGTGDVTLAALVVRYAVLAVGATGDLSAATTRAISATVAVDGTGDSAPDPSIWANALAIIDASIAALLTPNRILSAFIGGDPSTMAGGVTLATPSRLINSSATSAATGDAVLTAIKHSFYDGTLAVGGVAASVLDGTKKWDAGVMSASMNGTGGSMVAGRRRNAPLAPFDMTAEAALAGEIVTTTQDASVSVGSVMAAVLDAASAEDASLQINMTLNHGASHGILANRTIDADGTAGVTIQASRVKPASVVLSMSAVTGLDAGRLANGAFSVDADSGIPLVSSRIRGVWINLNMMTAANLTSTGGEVIVDTQYSRIQNALLDAVEAGTFPVVRYDRENQRAMVADNDVAFPAGRSANELSSSFGRARRVRTHERLERLRWPWQVIVSFNQQVTLELFERQLSANPPVLPRTVNQDQQVRLVIQNARYIHPPEQSSPGGTRAVFDFEAELSPV
jgi:hypothetical protein